MSEFKDQLDEAEEKVTKLVTELRELASMGQSGDAFSYLVKIDIFFYNCLSKCFARFVSF